MSITSSSASTELAVLAAGTRLLQAALRTDWTTPPTQALLGHAKLRFGSALCTCRPQPLKLQIRKREERFHLAVWPQEGPAHDSECLFFRDEVAESELAQASDAPVLPALQVPPSIGPAAAPLRRLLSLGKPLHPRTGEVQVSIRALGQQLWEAASLCRWHPSWSRDWGRTRYQLLRAAAELSINGAPAEQLIFIPRPYREAQQDVLNGEWDTFVRGLATAKDGLPRLLIAPVRKLIAPQGDGQPAVGLRHLRSPVGLHRACHDFIARDCRNVISNSRLLGSPARVQQTAQTPAGPEVIGFFAVEPSSRGGVWARAGWLMAVHPTTYIPAASNDVVLLIDALLTGGYAFQHVLSERQPTHRTTSDWLLRHVLGPDGQPVARAALEILNKGSGSVFHEVRAALAERMSAQGIPTWTWTPTGSRTERRVPPLPPTDQTNSELARDRLRQIALSPVADYHFGPSPKFFSTTERKSA